MGCERENMKKEKSIFVCVVLCEKCDTYKNRNIEALAITTMLIWYLNLKYCVVVKNVFFLSSYFLFLVFPSLILQNGFSRAYGFVVVAHKIHLNF